VADVVSILARRRVPLGFFAALVSVALADPTWTTWRAGLLVAIAGEAWRIWAAGHLEKDREVTRSGPYRWIRHPLYVGSIVLALGVVVACRSVIVTVLATVYMISTIVAAIRTEEAQLRQRFGETYDLYRQSMAAPMPRAFSIERVLRNREYRAVVGLLVGFALLALKANRSI
jgi:protein-S-isoprenylcysteine O-methyltransferase Ste14